MFATVQTLSSSLIRISAATMPNSDWLSQQAKTVSILGALPKGDLREVDFDFRGVVEVVCEDVQRHVRDDLGDLTIGEACAPHSLHVRVRSAAFFCN